VATENLNASSPTAVATESGFCGELAGHEFLITGFRTGNTEIYHVDPYTGDAKNLTRNPNSHQRYPIWSPSGDQFLFTSDRDGAYNLYLANADGSGVEQLTRQTDPSTVYFPSWAGDGTIAFGLAGPKAMVCVLSPDRQDTLALTEGRDPYLSPDGSQIAFTRWVESGYCVFTLDRRTSQVRQLTSHENPIGAVTPTFSPDGRYILYSDSVGETLEIFSFDLENDHSTRLTHLGQFATSPAWSPDQQWISFRLTDENFWNNPARGKAVHKERKGDKRPVWVMRADGSQPHIVEALRYQCGIDGSRAVWNPLGGRK